MDGLPDKLTLTAGEEALVRLPSLAAGYKWQATADNPQIVEVSIRFEDAAATGSGSAPAFVAHELPCPERPEGRHDHLVREFCVSFMKNRRIAIAFAAYLAVVGVAAVVIGVHDAALAGAQLGVTAGAAVLIAGGAVNLVAAWTLVRLGDARCPQRVFVAFLLTTLIGAVRVRRRNQDRRRPAADRRSGRRPLGRRGARRRPDRVARRRKGHHSHRRCGRPRADRHVDRRCRVLVPESVRPLPARERRFAARPPQARGKSRRTSTQSVRRSSPRTSAAETSG